LIGVSGRRRPHPKPKKPSPDRNLAIEQYPELNEMFYRSKPYSYFEHRLISLLLVVGGSAHVATALKEELSFGELKVRAGLLRAPDDQPSDYAAIESVVLFHHAAEALFRLYFAHLGGPPCPWIEASRVMLGNEFKQRLEGLLSSLGSEETRSDVLKVFRGTDTYASASEAFTGTVEQWNEQVQGLLDLLHHVGTELLTAGPLYNAAKHGLAVLSDQRGVKLDLQPDFALAAHGPPVSLLGVNRESARWERVTSWVEIDGVIAMTLLVVRELEALFQVARLRYIGETAGELPRITPEMVRRFQHPRADNDEVMFVVTSMNQELMYYADNAGPS
jgi:hypothetical protein